MELLSCLKSVFALFDCFGAILELLITGLMTFDQMLVQYKFFLLREVSQAVNSNHILLARAVSPELEAKLS